MLFVFKLDLKERNCFIKYVYIGILQMKLEIYRIFVENRDGIYDLYEMLKIFESMEESYKGKNFMLIRSFEFKIFFKVGKNYND